tara:strand:- start:3007 stop:3798 length:792 start_codon:yes stop_codon:yes gene_type:complete
MFDFPKKERAVVSKFKRNYLRSIILQFKFDENKSVVENRAIIEKIFADTYPRKQDKIAQGFNIVLSDEQTPVVQPLTNENGEFELRSNDGQATYSFSHDTISLTISGSSYSNFERMKLEIGKIQEVCKICKIDSLKRVAIRKLNIIEFIMQEGNNPHAMDLVGLILNQQLLSNLSYFPSLEHIKQNLNTIEYVDGDNRLNLRYGLLAPQPNGKTGQILIDIDLFTLSKVKSDQLEKVTSNINDEIFNIFMWTLSEKSIEHLLS